MAVFLAPFYSLLSRACRHCGIAAIDQTLSIKDGVNYFETTPTIINDGWPIRTASLQRIGREWTTLTHLHLVSSTYCTSRHGSSKIPATTETTTNGRFVHDSRCHYDTVRHLWPRQCRRTHIAYSRFDSTRVFAIRYRRYLVWYRDSAFPANRRQCVTAISTDMVTASFFVIPTSRICTLSQYNLDHPQGTLSYVWWYWYGYNWRHTTLGSIDGYFE